MSKLTQMGSSQRKKPKDETSKSSFNRSTRVENLPLMMRAIRKRQGLGQVQVSKYLDLEQSAYSRVEGGTQKLTAEQWFLFCDLTQTPPDAAFLGQIDSLRPIGSQENSFGLSDRHWASRGSTVRLLMPLINFAKNRWGLRKWLEFLEAVKIPPDFFLYLDHEVSLNFEIDLIKALIREGGLNFKILNHVFINVSDAPLHGQLRFYYRDLNRPDERIKKWLSLQKFYEVNFEYSVINELPGKLRVRVKPTEIVKSLDYRNDPELLDYLCQYRKAVLKGFSQRQGGLDPVELHEMQCHYKGSSECHYEFSY